MEQSSIHPPSDGARSEDILVWSLLQCGGDSSAVDVEELYLKCFELAPSKFAWRTRSDIPDYKKCAKALQAVEARTHVGALSRQGRYFRMLTPAGAAWCEIYREHLERLYSGTRRVAPASSSSQARLVKAARSSAAFQHWVSTSELAGPADLADCFRCSAASSPAKWAARSTELATAAKSLDDGALQQFALQVFERFGGGSQ